MEPGQQIIRTYFAKLGFETEIADIYLSLHADGPQLIAELARNAHVERTRIYRLIDTLLESNLIEIETRHKRGVIKAAPIANIRILIHKRQEEIKNLQDELELIEQTLARNSLSNTMNHIQTFDGPEGLRHMLWKELSAKTEILRYVHTDPASIVGKQFSERWATAFASGSVNQRCLYNGASPSAVLPRSTIRQIAIGLYPIQYTSVLYDDIVAYYQIHDAGVSGVAIRNALLAASQRQNFEILWEQST